MNGYVTRAYPNGRWEVWNADRNGNIYRSVSYYNDGPLAKGYVLPFSFTGKSRQDRANAKAEAWIQKRVASVAKRRAVPHAVKETHVKP